MSTTTTDQENHVIKRLFGVISLVVIVAVLGVAATRDATAVTEQNATYFGFLLGTPRIAGVAMEIMPLDAQGRRPFRAYVCDGFGAPQGISIWFSGFGPANVAPGTRSLSFPSVTGREELRFTSVSDRAVHGAFVDASGNAAQFVA